MVQTMNCLLRLYKLNNTRKKTEIENRYTLCDIPERYAVLEVKNRFATYQKLESQIRVNG